MKFEIFSLKGCTTKMKTVLGDSYRYGNVYGTLFIDGDLSDQYFEIWTLKVWHSICLVVNTPKKELKLYIDGSKTIHISDYNGFLKHASGDITLMKDKWNKKIQSDLADFQLWNEEKSEDFMKAYASCSTNETGNKIAGAAMKTGF